MSRNRQLLSPGNTADINGNGYGSHSETDDYDPYGNTYGDRFGAPTIAEPSPPLRSGRSRARAESSAEKAIGDVLQRIQGEWPVMSSSDCVPVHVALQLLDTSSVGRAHDYRRWDKLHHYLQDSLKAVVHEHHQGFNSAIGTYHKIQTSIQASKKRVRTLKDSLAQSKASLGAARPRSFARWRPHRGPTTTCYIHYLKLRIFASCPINLKHAYQRRCFSRLWIYYKMLYDAYGLLNWTTLVH